MGRLILCTSGKRSIGTTTFTLNLSKVMNDLLDNDVIVADLNRVSPDFYNILATEDNVLYKNLDIIMSYSVSKNELDSVINANKERLENSKLDVVFGSNDNEKFEDIQYINFLETIKRKYEIGVIDWGIDNIPNCIIDRVDTILFIVDQDKKSLKKMNAQYRNIINNDKTVAIINKFDSRASSLSDIQKLIDDEIEFSVPYESQVIKLSNSGNLNMNDTKYEDSIKEICEYILERFSIKVAKKNNLLSFFKKQKKGEIRDVKLDGQTEGLHR